MSTRRHGWPHSLPRTRLGWLALAAVALVTSGCRGLVGGLIETFTGEEVTFPDPPPRTVPPTVYLRGPVPGWDYRTVWRIPYRLPPALFRVDLFAGACPGLHLAGGEADGPFGALRTRAYLQLFEPAASHAAEPHYYEFGEVTLGGVQDPFPPGAFSRMLAQSGGACTSVGIPLLSLGRRAPYVAHW